MKKYIVLDNSWSLCLNSVDLKVCKLALNPQYVEVISEPYQLTMIGRDKEVVRTFIDVQDIEGFIYRVIEQERGYTISIKDAIERFRGIQSIHI